MEKDPEFKQVQVKTDDQGQVSAVIATFGVIDRDEDIVEPTAFKTGQEVAIVWSHDWSNPIGKGTIQTSATEAIFSGQFFMDTQAGQEAYKTVKAMGDLQEWSWGFRTLKSNWEQREDQMIRHLVECEVFEVSPVLKGAGIGTRTLAIKSNLSMSLSDQIQATREMADSLGARVRELKELRSKEGRELSAERKSELEQLTTELRQVTDLLAALTQNPTVDGQKLFNQYQQICARLNGVQEG